MSGAIVAGDCVGTYVIAVLGAAVGQYVDKVAAGGRVGGAVGAAVVGVLGGSVVVGVVRTGGWTVDATVITDEGGGCRWYS